MSELIERLADLTALHDREVLDLKLLGVLRDLLQPRSVTVYRCVGEGDDLRWLSRSRAVGASVQALPLEVEVEVEVETLPELAADPQRERCLREQTTLIDDGPPVRSYLPLGTERGPLGVIEIEHERPPSEAELRQAAGVARIYRNFLGLLDYSERDTLTGLLNRKTFDESFMKTSSGRPASRVGQDGCDYWLGVVDIDHFKHVNDRFGHLIGDEVLLLLARQLRASFRVQDRLYRFGGEEFVILLRCTGEDRALAAFERLRHNVQGFAFPQIGRITVSVGFTPVRTGDSPAAAFARADRAVYHAKAVGRNRVVSHASLVALGLDEEFTPEGGIELF